jgi:hypothetical protein
VSVVIWFVLVLVAWTFVCFRRESDEIRRLKEQNELLNLLQEAAEETSYETWEWLKKANSRRKRLERCLRKQRDLSDGLHRRNLNLLEDVRNLLKHVRELTEENRKATNLARSLAGELVGEVLAIEDRQAVTKGLTRKL